MKMRIPPVIVLFVLLPSFLISSDTTIADHLIFPNPAEKICFVTATGKSGKLLVGKKLPADHALVEKIAEQMNFPFHRSVIKLSQCTRNLSSDTKGPNVLFLSQTEGGFPRQGLILQQGDSTENYPGLFYVDLVLDEQRVARGELDIYSHELGHVMMLNIMGNEIPDSRSSGVPSGLISLGGVCGEAIAHRSVRLEMVLSTIAGGSSSGSSTRCSSHSPARLPKKMLREPLPVIGL